VQGAWVSIEGKLKLLFIAFAIGAGCSRISDVEVHGRRPVPISCQLNVQGLYGTELFESSLSGMRTLAWPERQLRPGERFETHAKFEPYVEAVVGQFLLGQVPRRARPTRVGCRSPRSCRPF